MLKVAIRAGLLSVMLFSANTAISQPFMLSEDQYLQLASRAYAAQGITLSPEQETALRQQYRQRMGMAGPASNSPASQPTFVAETEESLNAKILTFPASPSSLKIEDQRDGFLVNGRAYLDPEGTITNFAFDVLTGDVTYAVQTDRSNYIIKYTKAGTNKDGIPIATASRTDSGWSVQTVTGKRLSGELIAMMPKGIMLSRPSAAFEYVPGEGTKNISVPQGYIVAPMQHGNVKATNFILIQRVEQPQTSQNSISNLFGDIKSLGQALGVNKKEDYALMDINTGKLVMINISTQENDVASYGGCKQVNNFVNNCSSMETHASLYKADGSPNKSHYFWRINWFNAPSGPILVAEEDNLKDISVTDLTSGKKVIAFTRTLGIADFSAYQLPDGKVKIDAQLGFERKSIDDAAALLQATPDKPIQAVQNHS